MELWTPPYPELRVTIEESELANEEWGANCGPHSIAAVCGLTLAEVRPHIPNFRGWMNPTQVAATLKSVGRNFNLTKGLKTHDLCTGINRIQWEGSWLNPGVPPAAAYHYTHWVAHYKDPASNGGWVLCTCVCSWAWVHINEWKQQMPAHGTGWHVTHHYALN